MLVYRLDEWILFTIFCSMFSESPCFDVISYSMLKISGCIMIIADAAVSDYTKDLAMICLHDSSESYELRRCCLHFFLWLSIADFSTHLIISMFIQSNRCLMLITDPNRNKVDQFKKCSPSLK